MKVSFIAISSSFIFHMIIKKSKTLCYACHFYVFKVKNEVIWCESKFDIFNNFFQDK